MGDFFINGKKVEDKSALDALDRLATSSDAGVRGILKDRRIESADEAGKLLNASPSAGRKPEVIDQSDLDALNRSLGSEKRLLAYQFGTFANYLRKQFDAAVSRSIPPIDQQFFSYKLVMSPKRLQDLSQSLSGNSLVTIVGSENLGGLPHHIIQVSCNVNLYETQNDYRTRWDSFRRSVVGYYEQLVGNNGIHMADLPDDIRHFVLFLRSVPGELNSGHATHVDRAQAESRVGHEQMSAAQATQQPRTDAVARAIQGTLPATGGNSVLSSYSVLDALHLLLGGLNDQQYAETARRLGLHPDVRQQLAEAKALRASLRTTPDVTLSVANRVYAIPDSLQPDYVRTLEQFFESQGHAAIDFRKNPEQARRTINQWVGQQTNGLIPELLVSGDINQDTAFVLVNALYFKGKWTHPFDRSDTRDGDFTRANGTVVKTPMMSQTDSFAFRETGDYKVVALPYGQNEAMSMIVVLPAEGSRWQPDEAFYRNAGGQMSDERIYLQLPRFTVRSRVKLSEALGAMGLSDLDYSRMIRGPIDKLEAVTEVVFKVDEEGAEGAAATAAYATRGMVPTFRADRPFYFAVVHRDTGTILFSGQVADPSEGSR